jgi:molybdopterin-containing oxidoreductase family membrane subunit
MLATGLIVAYAYIMEQFYAYYSGALYEQAAMSNRLHGPYKLAYYFLILCNIITPQLLWFKRIRTSPVLLWILSIVVNCGMWLERFVIIVTSLAQDFLPSSWHNYRPTFWEVGLFIGTLGFFTTLLFLFIRFLPLISIFEMRTLLPEAEVHHAEAK